MIGLTNRNHRAAGLLMNSRLAQPLPCQFWWCINPENLQALGKKQDVRKHRGGYGHKHAVLTLIDRSSGEARSFHIDNADSANIVPIVRKNVAKETTIADEANYYSSLTRSTSTAP